MDYRTRGQWFMFAGRALLLPVAFWLAWTFYELRDFDPSAESSYYTLDGVVISTIVFGLIYLLFADRRRMIHTVVAQALFGWKMPEHGVLATGKIASMINVGFESGQTGTWRIRRWLLPSVWCAEVAFENEAGDAQTALVHVGDEVPGIAMLVGHEVELKYLPSLPMLIESPGLRSDVLPPVAVAPESTRSA